MASSDNLASMDAWTFRPTFPDSWISKAFARDTETLTKALQKSLSNPDYHHSAADGGYAAAVVSAFLNPALESPMVIGGGGGGGGSGSDPETPVAVKRGMSVQVNGGAKAATERKSRASKRSMTTFITADPANFRQMVQQVTGVRFSGGNGQIPAPVLVKPEPQRPSVINRVQQGCLPTLDTSAFLLDHHHYIQQVLPPSASACVTSFAAIYDPGIHTIHSLAQNSFEVVEALPTWKQPNDSVPLLSLGRLTLEGCVQEEKSQDLSRLMQIDGVEQRVTKSPRYLEGFTAQSTSSSRWPISLPDRRHIVALNLLEQSTKNVAHVARADQCSPTVPLPEKKMVRRTFKRKYRIMSVIFAIHQQHFGKRCEGTAKGFRATCICRNYGINWVSMGKRIHKQHGINQWPFRQSAIGLPDGGYILSLLEKRVVGKTLKRKCRSMSLFSLEDHQQHAIRRWGDAAKSLGSKHICKQLGVQHASRVKCIHGQHVFHRWPFQQNWETMKAYSVRDKRPAEVLSLSTDGKLVSRLQLVHVSWLVKFLPRPSAYQGGGEIVGPIALLSSEFAATNNRAHGIRKDQSGSSSASHSEEERPSHSEEERPGEPKDVEGTGSGISLEELQQLFDKKREDAAKSLKVSVSTFKRICRQHGIKPWPYQARKKAVKKPPDRHRGMNTTGSSDDRRNLSASQEEPLLRGHVSGPIYGTIPTCTDSAPGQPTPIVPHLTGNLLASEEEVLLRGHVSGPIFGTISSCTDPAPSQTTPIVPHPTGNLEDQRNLLALPEELLLSQRTPSIPPAMDGFAYWGDVSALFDDSFPEGHASGSLDCTAPPCSNPAPSQTMPTNATEMQNMDFVELKATYDDATFGNTTIKFQLPPKFETSELEEKVSKILKCELDSFRVEYKDKDEEWILMGCDENVREYLQLLNSLGNQVTKLKITKVPNTNLCETCGSSLMRKRPRHV